MNIRNINIFRLFFLLLPLPFTTIAQPNARQEAERQLNDRAEVYFSMILNEKSSLEKLSMLLSIGRLSGDTVYAFANRDQFSKFLELSMDYRVLTPPSLEHTVKMSRNLKDVTEWDSYPTYDMYITIMQSYASSYPQICRLEKIGESIDGRDLLFVKISDNVNYEESEPEFMYSSSMHGNELTGYVLLLRLIDYLLTGYGNDAIVTGLINNVQIWINPLANPDGTYAGGNNTVNGSTRFNSNQVDLNRNFPDPQAGLHPDGNDWQPENLAMMIFMSEHHFVLAANLHTGSEVLNYPWDTWQQVHADNDWYYYICRQYADTVHHYMPVSLPGYLTALNNGITNGYAWYPLHGGRQDYTNYFLHGREVTFELSYEYMPTPEMLPSYWDANCHSLLNYIRQCTFGIRGEVTDSVNGNPLNARIEILNHDSVHSEVYCISSGGAYFRPVFQGDYELLFSAPGYFSKILHNLQVLNDNSVSLNVILVPQAYNIQSINNDINTQVHPNPFTTNTNICFYLKVKTDVRIRILSFTGRIIFEEIIPAGYGRNEIHFDGSVLVSGIYYYHLTAEGIDRIGKLVKIKTD